MWCDECGEKMHDTVRDHEDADVELTCPQCRSSIEEMQLRTRLERMIMTTAGGGDIGCSEAIAKKLLAFEDLLTEVVHLCECETDGQPFFMLPPTEVARVISRAGLCTCIFEAQGHAAGTRATRLLRNENYGDLLKLAFEGYAVVLREARVSSVLSFLEPLAACLAAMAAEASPRATRVSVLLPGVKGVLEAERTTTEGRSPARGGCLPGKRARR